MLFIRNISGVPSNVTPIVFWIYNCGFKLSPNSRLKCWCLVPKNIFPTFPRHFKICFMIDDCGDWFQAYNKPLWFRVAWCRTSDKPLPALMMIPFTGAKMRHQTPDTCEYINFNLFNSKTIIITCLMTTPYIYRQLHGYQAINNIGTIFIQHIFFNGRLYSREILWFSEG